MQNKSNVEILTDFVKPLENNVMEEFMAFSEKLIENGILLDVKDVIALFKMKQAEKLAWIEYNSYIEKKYGKIPTITEYFKMAEEA